MRPVPVLLAIAVLCALGLLAASSSRESYGGPIRVLRRIPLTEAYAICDQYYAKCLTDTQYTDYDLCMRRRQNCRLQARYTNFHRL